MSKKERRKTSPYFEKVLAGGRLVITGIYAMSELTFSLSILSVTLLALVAFQGNLVVKPWFPGRRSMARFVW